MRLRAECLKRGECSLNDTTIQSFDRLLVKVNFDLSSSTLSLSLSLSLKTLQSQITFSLYSPINNDNDNNNDNELTRSPFSCFWICFLTSNHDRLENTRGDWMWKHSYMIGSSIVSFPLMRLCVLSLSLTEHTTLSLSFSHSLQFSVC
jgi:hypothetical protein